MVAIRDFKARDAPALWRILEPIVRAGETYPWPTDLAEAPALAKWRDGAAVRVAEIDGRVLGTAYLRPNQGGGGDHVANAGFAVHPNARGQGIADRLCADALEVATERGFLAMQFNFVVSANHGAVKLWRRHGFLIVGVLPHAFRHPMEGLVDVYVMQRFL